jgi:hypothetical protein
MKSVDAINHIHPPRWPPVIISTTGAGRPRKWPANLYCSTRRKVEAHEAQEPAWNASIDRTARQSIAIHPLLTARSVGNTPESPPIVTHDSAITKQHHLGGTLCDFATPAGSQNVASEASFHLDAGDWLFAVIEALVASGRPVGATLLPQYHRPGGTSWIMDIGWRSELPR